MAGIVLSIGASHSSVVSISEYEEWFTYGQCDHFRYERVH
jgi:hypothetical protein